MRFKKIHFPSIIEPTTFPVDIELAVPKDVNLPDDKQHFLIYIPWNKKYIAHVPKEFRDFFNTVLPYLHARTTDVHTAVCFKYFDNIVNNYKTKSVNRRILGLSLILHDSGWSKLSNEEIAASLGVSGLKLNKDAIDPKEKHAVKGAEIAKKILNNYKFNQPLEDEEKELIIEAVLYHDKPEEVAGSKKPIPNEVKLLIDIDHIWSFTHENFWQDTLRKGIDPEEYLNNLIHDLPGYFVTETGKNQASKLWEERKLEVSEWKMHLKNE